MSEADFLIKRIDDCHRALQGTTTEFMSCFTALQRLSILARRPGTLDAAAVRVLAGVLEDATFSARHQAFFYYAKAAESLLAAARSAGRSRDCGAFALLCSALGLGEGPALRAVVRMLVSLPVAICGPQLEFSEEPTRAVDWRQILEAHTLRPEGLPHFFGRSLAIRLRPPHEQQLLVFKFARFRGSIKGLVRELEWMQHLDRFVPDRTVRFDVPRALGVNGARVFRLRGLPVRHGRSMADNRPQGPAVAFLAHRDYFKYPNHPAEAVAADNGERFGEILLRNAWLLGRLCAQGIVHQAPIPLFHNRVQAHRREDRGLYEWFRGGRLDRWLSSCDYPNLGPTGIRDFEHFISVKGPDGSLATHIGNHLLSLLLLSGSYFRNRKPELVGCLPDGRPVDVRHLFDPERLRTLVAGSLSAYFEGFTGASPAQPLPVDIETLCTRMVEEMGVDRHMTETLRAADQAAMSEAVFRGFLLDRGLLQEGSSGPVKGSSDIVVHSGPHLGAFNRPISLPEIITAVGKMTAFCMAVKFRSAHRHQRVSIL